MLTAKINTLWVTSVVHAKKKESLYDRSIVLLNRSAWILEVFSCRETFCAGIANIYLLMFLFIYFTYIFIFFKFKIGAYLTEVTVFLLRQCPGIQIS